MNATRAPNTRKAPNGNDSLLLRIARRFSSGNELWDGLIRDCYLKPDMSCFQKNVYSYLDSALDTQDVNITQRLKFYRNQVQYDAEQEKEEATSDARSGKSLANFALSENANKYTYIHLLVCTVDRVYWFLVNIVAM